VKNLAVRVFSFYYDGFRSMTIGKKLWIIIIAKLIVFFLILKIFFFPDILKERFSTDRERSEYVIDELTKPK
jgi:Na+/H+ antiporter NhaD/arsenite permease-like protein